MNKDMSVLESCIEIPSVGDYIAQVEKQLAAALVACKMKDAIFEKIACLGNGDCHGNSIGNDLGKDGLAIQPDDAALKEWLGEPVAYVDEADEGKWGDIVPDIDVKIGTPLYSPKRLK